MKNEFDTPVLLILFNRLDTTQRVFNQIRKVRPKYLYVSADAPRPNHPDDIEKCRATRDIIKQIDWDCELHTCFRTENLGCGKGVVAAISWFFEQVEQGIILEDDIFPSEDFFYYCDELLHRYKDTYELALISGNNYSGKCFGEASYYFSCYPHTWGWATWRRTWEGFDMFLDDYSLKEFKQVLKWCDFRWNDRQMQLDRFKIMKKRGTDGWDWQFMFHIWRNRQLSIIPNVALIQNIGFGEDATHFKVKYATKSMIQNKLEGGAILPLTHPQMVERHTEADTQYLPCVQIVLPYFHRLVKIRKSFLWWGWRWFRRQVLVKPKLQR